MIRRIVVTCLLLSISTACAAKKVRVQENPNGFKTFQRLNEYDRYVDAYSKMKFLFPTKMTDDENGLKIFIYILYQAEPCRLKNGGPSLCHQRKLSGGTVRATCAKNTSTYFDMNVATTGLVSYTPLQLGKLFEGCPFEDDNTVALYFKFGPKSRKPSDVYLFREELVKNAEVGDDLNNIFKLVTTKERRDQYVQYYQNFESKQKKAHNAAIEKQRKVAAKRQVDLKKVWSTIDMKGLIVYQDKKAKRYWSKSIGMTEFSTAEIKCGRLGNKWRLATLTEWRTALEHGAADVMDNMGMAFWTSTDQTAVTDMQKSLILGDKGVFVVTANSDAVPIHKYKNDEYGVRCVR